MAARKEEPLRVLAVDSTTDCESVALVHEGRILAEVRMAASLHSRRLVPAIEFTLVAADLRPRDVEAYAVTLGPGSFTGLRVGLATIQGLALASGTRCLGVSALDVLAARIAGAGDALVALMDAQRGEVFGGVFDTEARPLTPPRVGSVESFLDGLPEAIALIGDGADLHRELIRRRHPGAVFPPRSRFLAATLGLLAEPRLVAGEGMAPASLRPIYLRRAHARPLA